MLDAWLTRLITEQRTGQQYVVAAHGIIRIQHPGGRPLTPGTHPGASPITPLDRLFHGLQVGQIDLEEPYPPARGSFGAIRPGCAPYRPLLAAGHDIFPSGHYAGHCNFHSLFKTPLLSR